jgi:hypothetical protein
MNEGMPTAVRTRPARRFPNGGSIRIAEDDGRTGGQCFCCGERRRLRFLQFHGPAQGDRMFLRICSDCIQVTWQEDVAMRATDPA